MDNFKAVYLNDPPKWCIVQHKGVDIRLASCSTGAGDNSFAQQLSKELGVRVMAPDDDLYYVPDEGTVFVGAPNHNVGVWRIFENGVEQ